MSKSSRNEAVKNLKANTMEKASDVPTVEFDFTNSTVENGPPTCPSQAHKPSMFSRRSSLKKYITPKASDNKNIVISNFAPNKRMTEASQSEATIELNESKLEAVHKMHKIIKNHILMNYMIKWIENGFMHFPDGSVSPIPEKDEMLEYSAIEKEDNHYLHPITEESLGEIDQDGFSSDSKYKKWQRLKLEKLRNAIEICQNIDNKPEIMLLKAFKEWKRLGIKISLEKLLQYRETLDRLQSMPMSEEDYYFEGDESELSQL